MNKRIDLLNRETFIDNVIQLVCQLSENKKGCCFAIEGGWGIGKTFVVEEIEAQLRVLQSEETCEDRFFVFHYNCWQHDYYEEPAIAIVSAMQNSIMEDQNMVNGEAENIVRAGYQFVGEQLKKIAGLYLENKIGINLIEWVQEISERKESNEAASHKFDTLFNFNQTIEKVRQNLREIAGKRTVVLMVDELDRCVPQYAIKVMERLHHIFYGLDNIVVIIAIDRKQLEHSVEEMFGIAKDSSSIDVEKYLKKFIDFSMLLDHGAVNASLAEKYSFYFDRFTGSESDLKRIYEIWPALFYGIDIRRQEKIIEKANIVHSVVCNEKADLSVLLFEMIYEVLKLLKFYDMKYVVTVNDVKHTGMEAALGKRRMDLLKKMENESWSGNVEYVGEIHETKKRILFNLYGRVIWYFAKTFYDEDLPYASKLSSKEDVKKGVKTVEKYCRFGEILQ